MPTRWLTVCSMKAKAADFTSAPPSTVPAASCAAGDARRGRRSELRIVRGAGRPARRHEPAPADAPSRAQAGRLPPYHRMAEAAASKPDQAAGERAGRDSGAPWAEALFSLLRSNPTAQELRAAVGLLAQRGLDLGGKAGDAAALAGMRSEHFYRSRKSLDERIGLKEWLEAACRPGRESPRGEALPAPDGGAASAAGATAAPAAGAAAAPSAPFAPSTESRNCCKAAASVDSCEPGTLGGIPSSSYSSSLSSLRRKKKEKKKNRREEAPSERRACADENPARQCALGLLQLWREGLSAIPESAPDRPVVHFALKPEIVEGVRQRLEEGYDGKTLGRAVERFLLLARESAQGGNVFCPRRWGLDDLMLRRTNKAGPFDYVEKLLQPDWRERFLPRGARGPCGIEDADVPERVRRKWARELAEPEAECRIPDRILRAMDRERAGPAPGGEPSRRRSQQPSARLAVDEPSEEEEILDSDFWEELR